MTLRIQKAIDIFLDAINNGTLASGTCTACACGNLVAHAIGYKIEVPKTLVRYHSEPYPNAHWLQAINPHTIFNQDLELGRQQISATGFTVSEFKKIESAFEQATQIAFYNYRFHTPEEIRQDQINGLKAVVEVMMSFENCEDSVDEVFTQKAKLIPIGQ